jgi:alkylhydroperoxidase family enzyme
MADIAWYRAAVVARVLDGDGRASREQRKAAFERPQAPLLDKVARHAYRVTDDDIAAAKAAGLGEDEIFELVVCAALGQATRQLESALAALDIATRKDG